MHKKCKEILKELESGKKLKVWWDFQFPEKEELKIKLKDILENEVDEKYYLKEHQIESFKNSNYITRKKRLQEKDYCDTLCTRDYKEPKCIQIGKLDMRGNDCIKRVYSDEGIAPTLTTMQGGNTQPKIITYNISQKVKVRKYNIDIYLLKAVLTFSKKINKITNSEISEKLKIPITQVEHYFRYDNSFAIPSPEIWFELKNILNIQTDIFDESIMTFEEKENTYEKANRIYDDKGIAPTLTTNEQPKILYNPYNKKVINEIAPTQTCSCGSISSSSQVLSLEKNNSKIRKLTPKECWRLMGFNDEDFEKAKEVNSNSQLYKQAGNSIVVKVLEKIFLNLFKKKNNS